MPNNPIIPQPNRRLLSHQAGSNPFEERLDRALASVPSIQIPRGFAARVAARAPAPLVFQTRRTSVGHSVTLSAVAALLVILLLTAPRMAADPSLITQAMQWVLCLELTLLAATVVAWRQVWP